MKILKDIRFWLALNLLFRLFTITQAPLDGHAWRQAATNMAAKNYYLGNTTLLYPRMDIMFLETTSAEGISPMEFPVFNYSIALMAKIFGWQDWYGRLINLIISTLGIWCFYLLIKRYFSEKMAFYSSFFLSFSLWWTFSRKVMPDTFSMSLALIGLYFGFCYLEEKIKEYLHLTIFFVAFTLGALAKIPVLYLAPLFIFPIINPQIPLKKKVVLSLVGLIGLIPVYWWYFIWCAKLTEQFNNRMFFLGKSLTQGMFEIIKDWPLFLEHFVKISLGHVGFVISLLGLILVIKHKEKKTLSITLILSFTFMLFVFKSGYNFVHHNYYNIPFVPVMCLLAAYAISIIPNKKIVVFILLLFLGDNIAKRQHEFRLKKDDLYRLQAKEFIHPFIPINDLIVINGGPNPVDLYFLNRRGWSLNNIDLTEENIELLKTRNVKFLVVNRHNGELSFERYKVISENKDYRLYEL